MLHGLSKAETTERGDQLLEQVGLSGAADRRVGQYSGGMRRRLDLALVTWAYNWPGLVAIAASLAVLSILRGPWDPPAHPVREDEGTVLELTHTVVLPTSPSRAWATLDDADRVAAALPGARATRSEGDVVSGQVTLKIGPISTAFEGKVTVIDRDRLTRRFVLDLDGAEVDGVGTVAGTCHVRLIAEGEHTAVEVRTLVGVTGRLALYGEAVVDDLLGRLLADLADALTEAGLPRGRRRAPTDAAGAAAA